VEELVGLLTRFAAAEDQRLWESSFGHRLGKSCDRVGSRRKRSGRVGISSVDLLRGILGLLQSTKASVVDWRWVICRQVAAWHGMKRASEESWHEWCLLEGKNGEDGSTWREREHGTKATATGVVRWKVLLNNLNEGGNRR